MPDNTWGILPLDSGPMTGTATHLSFGPGFAITDGSFSRGIRAVGVASPDRWMIAGLCKGWAVSHGGRMGAGDLTILAPGRELYVRFSNQTRYFAALIAPEEAWAFLASHSRAFEDLEHHQLAVLNVPPEIARSNVHQLNILIHALKLHGANMSDAMVDYYKRSILDILMRPLSSTVHHHDDAGIMAMSLVREVDRYIMKPGIALSTSLSCVSTSRFTRKSCSAPSMRFSALRPPPSYATSGSQTPMPRSATELITSKALLWHAAS